MRQWRITTAAARTAPEPFDNCRVSRRSHVASRQPPHRRARAAAHSSPFAGNPRGGRRCPRATCERRDHRWQINQARRRTERRRRHYRHDRSTQLSAGTMCRLSSGSPQAPAGRESHAEGPDFPRRRTGAAGSVAHRADAQPPLRQFENGSSRTRLKVALRSVSPPDGGGDVGPSRRGNHKENGTRKNTKKD